MTIKYRLAVKDDAAQLAQLIYDISTLPRYLYTDAKIDKSPIELLKDDLMSEDAKYSYTRCLVALHDEKIIGVCHFYPSDLFKVDEEMKNKFSDEKLDCLKNFYACKVEKSLYLSGLFVADGWRGHKIGQDLVDRFSEIAKAAHYSLVCVHCWAANREALRFYENYGFKEISRLMITPSQMLPFPEGCVQLYKSIE